MHQHKRLYYQHLANLSVVVGLHREMAEKASTPPVTEQDWAQQSHVLKLALRRIMECDKTST